jgi:FHA domain
MTDYIGIDFGNAMVKAAAVESPDGPPRTLRLSERDPFLPLALRKGKSGFRAGWSAFSHRRRDGMNTVVAMRDQWSSAALTASVAGRPQPVTTMLGKFLAATGARVQHAAKDAVGVVITVPDAWTHDDWALPVAVHNAGWTPEAYVREWAAALAVVGPATGSAVVLLSLGFSSARATLCRMRHGAWKPVASVSDAAFSGLELRKRIVAGVAEAIIRQARRDPREDPESDQDLHDAVEAALYQLHREPAAAVKITLSGTTHSSPCTRESLTAQADDFPTRLQRLLARVRDSQADAAGCAVIVWGELTGLLPIKDWLAGRGTVHVQSLDSLAAGAARICAAMATGIIKASVTPTAAVCPQCGNHSALKKEAACPQCRQPLVTVWEVLPATVRGERAAATATLTLQDAEDESKIIDTDHFRLGRSPQSEWVFTDDRYPGVSNAHAVISRRGERFLLRDLGSTNGTLLNGSRLDGERELKPGDEIRLGQAGPRIVFDSDCQHF